MNQPTPNRLLALDISTKTGWAVFEGSRLLETGVMTSPVVDFNVNNHPEKSPHYPFNMIDAANNMAASVGALYEAKQPQKVVIENTVRGRNRHTQRILEFIHKSVLEVLRSKSASIQYMDVSEWRKILEVHLNTEDKKNNRLVAQGKKRGRITKKHLSVRMANALYGLELKIKDNDIADAICMGRAFCDSSN